MARLLLINGPNLNLLGTREPELYGNISLDSIVVQLKQLARGRGHTLISFQSNAEHELIGRIHEAAREYIDFIIINPAALTHTSIALRDALLGTAIPFIELHLSNVYRREPFRQQSYLSDIAQGVITGFGAKSYELALEAALHCLADQQTPKA